MKKLILLLLGIIVLFSCEKKITEQEEPIVNITAPSDNAVVFEIVEIIAEATDNKGITRVEFCIDDTLKGTDTQAPYSYSWNTLSYEDSTFHTIYAKAYDTDDNVTGSKLITVMVNNSLALPMPVVLYEPSEVTDSAILLTWAKNQNDDFEMFKIFRSLSEGVTENSEQLITIYEDTAISYLVEGLQENQTYFFRVLVYDSYNFSSESNEVSATTLNREPNAPTLCLYDTTSVTEDSIKLCWTQNSDHDFYCYRLYRLLSAGVDTNSTLAFETQDIDGTCCTDTGLESETEYFYRVYVFDTGGLASGSNVLSFATLTQEPSPVILYEPHVTSTTVRLKWSQNHNVDFKTYELYRSLNSGVDLNSDLIIGIPDQRTITFLDKELTPETEYFYRIFVFDEDNFYSGSNEINVTMSQTPQLGYSLQFDGIDDYIDAGNVQIDLNQDLTFEAWVKTPPKLNNVIITQRHACNSNSLTLVIRMGGKASFSIENGGIDDIMSSTYVGDNNWHHIAGTKRGNHYSIFVDGVLESTKWNEHLLHNSPDNLHFGHHGAWHTFFDGFIDEIHISNTVRYTSDFMPSMEPVADEYTIGLWDFNEGSGNIAYDSSGNGNHGTIYGATWVER